MNKEKFEKFIEVLKTHKDDINSEYFLYHSLENFTYDDLKEINQFKDYKLDSNDKKNIKKYRDEKSTKNRKDKLK